MFDHVNGRESLELFVTSFFACLAVREKGLVKGAVTNEDVAVMMPFDYIPYQDGLPLSFDILVLLPTHCLEDIRHNVTAAIPSSSKSPSFAHEVKKGRPDAPLMSSLSPVYQY